MSAEDEEMRKNIADALNMIEGVHSVVSMVNSIKTGLEAEGWAPSPASHAATTLGNTMLMAGMMQGSKT